MSVYNKLSKNLEEDNILFVPYFENTKKIQNEAVKLANIKEQGYTFENIRELYIIGEKIKRYIDEDFDLYSEYSKDMNSKNNLNKESSRVFNVNFGRYIRVIPYEFYKHIIERIVCMKSSLSLDIGTMSSLLFEKNEDNIIENLEKIRNLIPNETDFGDDHSVIENELNSILEKLKLKLDKYNEATNEMFLKSFLKYLEGETYIFNGFNRKYIVDKINEEFKITIS